MIDQREFEAFLARFRSEIIEEANGDAEDGTSFKEDAFTSVVLEYLAEEEGLEDPVVCRFAEAGRGRANGRINGYALYGSREEAALFVSSYLGGEVPEQVATAEVRKQFDRVRRVFDLAMSGYYEQRDHGHEDFDMFQKLFEARETLREVRLYVLTDGLTDDVKVASVKDGDVKFTQHVWDIRRLFRCFGAGTPRADIVVDFERDFGGPLPCLPMPASSALKDYDSYLAIVPGAVLAELYGEFGERLLERNVRSFLETKGKVNKGIRDTILHQPGRFFAYNNGISLVADDVDVIKLRDGGLAIRRIKGPQIVNGGQTTASLFRASSRDNSKLDGIFIQAKVSKVDGAAAEQIVHQISRSANSQNAVNDADFYANDPFHMDLERLSRSVWDPNQSSQWFYERARGQYQVAKLRVGTAKSKLNKFEAQYPARQRFDKTSLGRYCNAWDQYPYLVCLGGQKNFVKFMERVKSRDTDPIQSEADFKRLIAKIILFRDTEKAVRQVKDIQGYRGQVAAYLVSLLSRATDKRLDLDRIWRDQAIPSQLHELLLKIAKPVHDLIVSSAKGRNVTEWCKKADCWKQLQEYDIRIPAGLLPRGTARAQG